ncbi:MAG: hypothetical protein P9M13_04795 [Candidatus Ancaeobacter aquaticus]|nr:hypothetical protein [Candidatus Ancaeobacter aquaticus]
MKRMLSVFVVTVFFVSMLNLLHAEEIPPQAKPSSPDLFGGMVNAVTSLIVLPLDLMYTMTPMKGWSDPHWRYSQYGWDTDIKREYLQINWNDDIRKGYTELHEWKALNEAVYEQFER